AWEAYGHRAGLSPARIADGFRWYQTHYRPGMRPKEVAASFREFAGRNWNDAEVVSAARFHDSVVTSGPAQFLPTVGETNQRLAELNRMSGEPESEYYTSISSKDLKDEHLFLLEQQELDSAATLERGSYGGQVIRPDLARLNQMAADANSAYYTGKHAK